MTEALAKAALINENTNSANMFWNNVYNGGYLWSGVLTPRAPAKRSEDGAAKMFTFPRLRESA